MQKILLLTQDEHLPKYLQKLGTLMCTGELKSVPGLLEMQPFDLVIVGPPFKKIDAAKIEHENVKVIEEPEDLKRLLEAKQFQRQEQYKRKIRVTGIDNIDYSEATGKVLLITTNAEVIKTLKGFDLMTVTNEYSAQQKLNNITNNFSLIIWNLEKPSKLKTDHKIYRWQKDIFTPKDIYMLLTTGQLSLESKYQERR